MLRIMENRNEFSANVFIQLAVQRIQILGPGAWKDKLVAGYLVAMLVFLRQSECPDGIGIFIKIVYNGGGV